MSGLRLPRPACLALLVVLILLGGPSGCGQTGPLMLPEADSNSDADDEESDDG